MVLEGGTRPDERDDVGGRGKAVKVVVVSFGRARRQVELIRLVHGRCQKGRDRLLQGVAIVDVGRNTGPRTRRQ